MLQDIQLEAELIQSKQVVSHEEHKGGEVEK